MFKLIGALVVVLAFSVVAVATASAETLWKWLPGTVGETFKGKSGEAELRSTDEGKALTIKCKKTTNSSTGSELLKEGSTGEKDVTLALFMVNFEGCTSLGLAANSVGDTSGIILTHIEAHNCMIAPGKFGLILSPLQVHIEIPAAKVLILVKGAVIAELLGAVEGEKILTYKLDLNAPGGVQAIKKCEGSTESKLEASLNGTTFFAASEEAKEGVLEFDMTKDTLGEEMMEK